MNIRRNFLIALLGAATLLTARPGATFTMIEKNAVDAHMTLSQAAFCDGSVRTRLAVSRPTTGAAVRTAPGRSSTRCGPCHKLSLIHI